MINIIPIYKKSTYYFCEFAGDWYVFALEVPESLTVDEYEKWIESKVVYGQPLHYCGFPQKILLKQATLVEELRWEDYVNTETIPEKDIERIKEKLYWGDRYLWGLIVDSIRSVYDSAGSPYNFNAAFRDAVVMYYEENMKP